MSEEQKAIDGNDEEWNLMLEEVNYRVYQHKTRKSLYKKEQCQNEGNDITIFTDLERWICIDINTTGLINLMYECPIARNVADSYYPISFPYTPPDPPFQIYVDMWKSYKDTKNVADTVGVFYARTGDDSLMEIKRFFKEDPNTHSYVEISRSEYAARRQKGHQAL